MHGPSIIARTLSERFSEPDKRFGNRWQYHSRSDHHSKVCCWATLFDLLLNCPLLVQHVESGRVAFGINHEMVDFEQDRQKNLDLVICSPRDPLPGARASGLTFKQMAVKYEISLSEEEEQQLASLPDIPETPVESVYIAVEAKACMTAHSKARPRLYDELNSSHSTIHGCADTAIAVGLVLVNHSKEFISPDMNKFDLSKNDPYVNRHDQPKDTERVIEKILKLPRSSGTGKKGYDAIGLTVVDMRNDGGPVELIESPPAPQPGDILHYDQMIGRIRSRYTARFPQV